MALFITSSLCASNSSMYMLLFCYFFFCLLLLCPVSQHGSNKRHRCYCYVCTHVRPIKKPFQGGLPRTH